MLYRSVFNSPRLSTKASLKALASVALVVLIGALAVKLALAPLYQRYSAEQCRQAYASARTRADTIAVDFRPYASPLGGRNPRCGQTRVAAEITALRQP